MRHSLPLLLGLSLTACITRARHDQAMNAAQRELDAAHVTLEQERATLGEVLEEAERQSLEARRELASLRERLAEAERKLAQTEAQRGELERSLAQSVRDKSKLRDSVASMSAALAAQAARNILAEQRIAEFRRMLERFKPLIDAGRLDVRIVDGRMVLQLPGDVLFAPGKARLSPEGETTLREVGAILALMPDRVFQVEGHTDDVPIRSSHFADNWALAAARALAVVAVLIDADVATVQLSAAAYADTRPTATNDDDAGRAKNRRIEIAVIPDLSTLPGFDELTRMAGSK